MIAEPLPDGHVWLRVARPAWSDPLDAAPAAVSGGRWNPPDSWPTLYLNEDITTARINVDLFIDQWPYEPEDLVDEQGPVLVSAQLPDGLTVADVHTPAGVAAAGLPSGYPLDGNGIQIGRAACQPIGRQARDDGLDGVRARSARTPRGAGRELAWFPAGDASAAVRERRTFGDWYFG
ncbi:MAG TPA: RES family NAD+ phosphorylase [Actinomycetales bacterium]|nr:RES family NAD+ phosphorylase [Actinomycetales bacterium]